MCTCICVRKISEVLGEMNDYRYIEVKLKDCSDLFKIQQSSLSRFVFRGQGSEKWPLETSIRRMITRYHTEAVDPRKFDDYERAMLKEFKWKYPGYQLNTNMVPDPDNDVEWLSLMQHYGAKTRLLDFSYSIYVALYMAIYGLDDMKEDAVIWALNADMLRRRITELFYKDSDGIVDDNFMYISALKSLQSIPFDEPLPERILYLFQPRICNERISRQQGLFVMPSTISMHFEDVLSAYCDVTKKSPAKDIDELMKEDRVYPIYQHTGMIKIIVPHEMRYDMVRALEAMNISAETMYPGLVGLAESMNRLRDKL